MAWPLRSPQMQSKLGLPPGTVVHVGPPREGPVCITTLAYGPDRLEERPARSVDEAMDHADGQPVSWINIDGVHDVAVIEAAGQRMGLHPLVMEDIAHTTQRPKMEQYDSCLFIVARMLMWDAAASAIRVEQVSFVLAEGRLVTFQEVPGDVFDGIRERIRADKGRIRRMGADYLLYALLDGILDHYYVVMERLGERIEELEDPSALEAGPEVLQKIRRLRRQMVDLRRAVWPMREVVGGLERGKASLISEETGVYLRDLYDHSVQILETVETYRDTLAGVLDLYMTASGNRMNEIMKVLTIIATIFIPLTFIAGIYGMNFDPEASPWNMPELTHPYGYPIALGAMGVVVMLMLLYFRRKKWI